MNSISNTVPFDKYFKMNTGAVQTDQLQRMQRVCTSQRNVIKSHFDRSKDMQNAYVTRVPSSSWPLLNREFIDDFRNIVCTGASSCTDEGLCGCTRMGQERFEGSLNNGSPIAMTPLTMARDYLLSGMTVELNNDFLDAEGAGVIVQVRNMKIPAYKYAKLELDDTSGRIKSGSVKAAVDIIVGVIELLANSDRTNFDPQPVSRCQLVDITLPQYAAARSCMYDDENDPKIKQAMEAFPGGLAALEENKKKPPYLIIAMGRNTQQQDWNQPNKVLSVYRGDWPVPTTGQFLDGRIRTVVDNVDVFPFPDHGAMVLDLFNDKRVNLGYRGPKSDRMDGTGSMESAGKNDPASYETVDSFCGFGPTNTPRDDECGQFNGPLLSGCPQDANQAKPHSRRDKMNNQTCIHDHSCVLSMMSFGTRTVGKTFVAAPGWNILNHQDAPARWTASISTMKNTVLPGGRSLFDIATSWDGNFETRFLTQAIHPVTRNVPWKDTLPILELWRLYSNPVHPTKFYLPIGVFLQTWNALTSEQQRINPSLEPGLPISHMGMWGMCPHVNSHLAWAGAPSTDAADASKSRMFLPENTPAGQAFAPYQNPREVGAGNTDTCIASNSGIQECTVSGWRSYRVGLTQGTVTRDSHGILVTHGIIVCILPSCVLVRKKFLTCFASRVHHGRPWMPPRPAPHDGAAKHLHVSRVHLVAASVLCGLARLPVHGESCRVGRRRHDDSIRRRH